ncbi:zinc-ribbon and DUF3426 domain-containing protein [Piscinibacter sakaiensis]|uniref:Zinc finger/thioredoxin putative domain-containing protein n=2 Tax=Piscinibacter sakaiensis TaxID=1547922 RepID=A0A0K8NY98_PISS1|nr:zinc-ribbon and DUF3426 domain-containing protein [Piscinibacter sakaiensis]GAP35264.1 hypothetical protein ISF6_0855 [Piscinibacter sakaiensis]
MSLATRCSHCGTLFRVVQDQLRVSEGWVRCGRCDTVFNALDGLVELAADGSPLEGAPRAAATPPGPARRIEPAFDEPGWPPVADPDEEPAGAGRLLRPAAPDAPPDRDPDPAQPAEPRSAHEPGLPIAAAAAVAAAMDAAPEDEPPAPPLRPGDDAPHAAAERDAALPPPPVRPPAPVRAPAPAPAAPGFVRQADRAARWNSPAMRAALGGCAVLLALVGAVQAGIHFRDDLAARSPLLAGWLRAGCARWGCEVSAPRHLDQVRLDGSKLARVGPQGPAVRLTLQLRNLGRTALAVPAVELSLTDIRGELIARRTLLPADFGLDDPVIPRGGELPLELVLSAGERTINGYTVELFYP